MSDSLDDFNYFKLGFYLILCVLYFLMIGQLYPDAKYYFPYAIVHIFVVFWFFSVGRSILWRSRYRGFQVTVNGCNGSIYGKPEYIPDPVMGSGFHWAVFNLGYSHIPPLRGKLATLVVPANQIFPAGKNFIGRTLVTKWDISILPPNVATFLRENSSDFNLENIYFGKYSQEFVDNSGIENDLNSQINAKNSEINILRKAMQNKFNDFEEMKAFADRVTGDKWTFRKMLSKAVKSEDEE